MRTYLIAAVAALTLAGCAQYDQAATEYTGLDHEGRCKVLAQAAGAARLRLEAPLYLQDEQQIAMAKRALADAELAAAIAGCTGYPFGGAPEPGVAP